MISTCEQGQIGFRGCDSTSFSARDLPHLRAQNAPVVSACLLKLYMLFLGI